MVIVPASILYVLFTSKDKLEKEKFNMVYNAVYEELKITSKLTLSYRLWFCLRRFIFIASIFLLDEYPVF